MANHDKRRSDAAKESAPPTSSEPALGDAFPVSKELAEAAMRKIPEVEPKQADRRDLDAYAPRPRAILWSVKVRDGALIVGASPTEEIHPNDPKSGWDVVVCGPSVLVIPPLTALPNTASLRGGSGGPSSAMADVATAHEMPEDAHKRMRVAHELPRSACVIRWLVPAHLSAEEMAEAVFDRGFGSTSVAPERRVAELRKKRLHDEVKKQATAAAAAKSKAIAKGKAPGRAAVDEEDDGFIGSGPAAEASDQ